MEKALSVSFVMPMYNERDNISVTIDKIISVAKDISDDYEVIVVDDASTDGSSDIVDSIAQMDPNVRSFRLETNSMFGGAFARAFKEASKDIIVYLDSDLPVRLEDIRESFPLIAEASIVTGYSKVNKGDTLARKIISKGYNLFVQIFFGLNVRDINSGYKIVRKELVKELEFISRSPFIDVELFLQARRNKAIVRQFPLIFYPRSGGKSYIARMPVILATFRDMLKVRLSLFKLKR